MYFSWVIFTLNSSERPLCLFLALNTMYCHQAVVVAHATRHLTFYFIVFKKLQKEKGKQSAKKRAVQKPNQLIAAKDVEELPSSIDLPIICDVTSLSKDNTEKRPKTPTPYLDIYLNVQESNDGVIADSR